MSMENEVDSTTARSSFVTVVAWIFIVLSGFGTMIAVLQNIMIQTMFNTPEMAEAVRAPPPPGLPPLTAFMTSHFQLFFAAFLVVSALMLAASIGLLKRKNWARLLFIGLMVFGIAWNMAGLALQFAMFSSMQDNFPKVEGAPDMLPFMIAVAVFSVVLAIGLSVLFGWIVRRLLAPAIVAEFGR